jgi:hypothetical protein
LEEDRAFDAVESYLCEAQDEPCTEWRTVSLVTAIHGVISHGPEFEKPTPEARHDLVKAAADELSRRGLDGLALIRYGMTREVVAPLLAVLLVKLLFNDVSDVQGAVDVSYVQGGVDVSYVQGGVDVSDGQGGVDVDRWCAVLGLEPVAEDEDDRGVPHRWFQDVLLPVLPRINQWVASASIDELVDLTPPATEELAWLPTGEPLDRTLRDQYRWAVDHFAKTYFREWSTTSLHFELRWLDGDLLPPCPNDLMTDRTISKDQIAREIARRAVYHERPDPGESLVTEMSRHAMKLLRSGRCREAAAVFEFGVDQRPEDSEVRNNLGFCLIPIDPREALEHLKIAANLGYRKNTINAYNQMCCYMSIGRSRAALNIADEESQNPKHFNSDVLLWRASADGNWELFECDYPFRAVAQLASEIARTEGWKDLEEHWAAMSKREPEASTSQKAIEGPLSLDPSPDN